jgi:CDP-diacylglycerol--glycerol-3-phosphate 3-phosphatidyltransferase
MVEARLRREWAVSTASGLGVLAALSFARPSSLLVSVAVWAFCCWQLFRALPENRRPGEEALLPTLGGPTHLTLIRGLLIALVAGFFFEPRVAAPAYTAAALLDCLDGRLARRQNRETGLGSRLDMETDALGILVASLAGIATGKLPPWYLAIGLARYLFVLGIEWRRLRRVPVGDLDPSRWRRILAGMQMGFLSVALWPEVPASLSRSAAYAFGGATLVFFARDWFVVSSRKASTPAIESSHRG